MAILHMQLALACLELSYSMTPVYHCSSTQQLLPLFALSLSMSYKASVAVAKPGAGLAEGRHQIAQVISLLSREQETPSGRSGLLSSSLSPLCVHLPQFLPGTSQDSCAIQPLDISVGYCCIYK